MPNSRKVFLIANGVLLLTAALGLMLLQTASYAQTDATPNSGQLTFEAVVRSATQTAIALTPVDVDVSEFGDPVQLTIIYDAQSLTVIVEQDQVANPVSLEGIQIYVPETNQRLRLETTFGRMDRVEAPSCFYLSVDGEGIPSTACLEVGASGFVTRPVSLADIVWANPNTQRVFPLDVQRGADSMGELCSNPNQACEVVYVPPAPELDPAADLLTHSASENPITESRVCVQAGEQVALTGDGVYTVGQFVGQANANGPLNTMWDNEFVRDSYNLPGYTNLPHAALLYRVGENGNWQPCNCATQNIITVNTSGCLQFTINDRSPIDNIGEVNIEVEKLN